MLRRVLGVGGEGSGLEGEKPQRDRVHEDEEEEGCGDVDGGGVVFVSGSGVGCDAGLLLLPPNSAWS